VALENPHQALDAYMSFATATARKTSTMSNVQPYESEITRAKSSKSPGMFQCDAIDTSPDLGGKNVPKTVEMADIKITGMT